MLLDSSNLGDDWKLMCQKDRLDHIPMHYLIITTSKASYYFLMRFVSMAGIMQYSKEHNCNQKIVEGVTNYH